MVDIYIPSLHKVVEVNGEYWHGHHDRSVDQMTPTQREGYQRDLKRINAYGEENVLFLWETDINDGSFKEYLNKYLRGGGLL
jgi:G:T-mismatch repair DNA endonuclease (very short patch repair protein)